jgi:L-threonylcarbamoyladenylate synthase
MTLILERTENVRDFITGGQDTVGLRVPSDPIALALIQEFERISDSAIAAPSANQFGQVSPTSSADVQEELGKYLSSSDLVLDGGRSQVGIESTIIACTGSRPIILRSGFITREDIESILGILDDEQAGPSDIKFSGSFEKHYAPKCKVVLDDYTLKGAGFLALMDVKTPPGMVRLSSPTSLEEFAHVLYSTFRQADREGLTALVVCSPKSDGLGTAILERLRKASR